MTPIVLYLLLLIRYVSSFRSLLSIVADIQNNRVSLKALNCLPIETGHAISSGAETRFTFGNSFAAKIKLPTQDVNIVDRFLKETDYIIENVWDKLKISKIAPGNYGVQLSAIPVPGWNIISPEMEVKLSNHDGTLNVNCSKWTFKDGCGKLLVDPAFNIVDLTLKGNLRVLNSYTGNEVSEEIVKMPSKKWIVGGLPVFVKGSAEYRLCGHAPSSLQQQGMVDKIKRILETRFYDFMQTRMPMKLTKAFKAYASKMLKAGDMWC